MRVQSSKVVKPPPKELLLALMACNTKSSNSNTALEIRFPSRLHLSIAMHHTAYMSLSKQHQAQRPAVFAATCVTGALCMNLATLNANLQLTQQPELCHLLEPE